MPKIIHRRKIICLLWPFSHLEKPPVLMLLSLPHCQFNAVMSLNKVGVKSHSISYISTFFHACAIAELLSVLSFLLSFSKEFCKISTNEPHKKYATNNLFCSSDKMKWANFLLFSHFLFTSLLVSSLVNFLVEQKSEILALS